MADETPPHLMTVAERLRHDLDMATVKGESPRGFVTVERDENNEVKVRLKPDTLQRLNEKQLADEITGAMQAALDDYSRTTKQRLRQLTTGEGTDQYGG